MVRSIGYPTRPDKGSCRETKNRAAVLGMTCADCPFNVAVGMVYLEGVQRVEVDFDAKRACVVVDPPGTVSDKQLIAVARARGYLANVVSGE